MGGFLDHRQYRLQNAFDIRQYIVIPEADNAITQRVQSSCPTCILFNSVCVLTAVEFDDQLAGWNGEISNMTPDRVLPSDFDGQIQRTQFAPQFLFGIGCISAQISGACCP